MTREVLLLTSDSLVTGRLDRAARDAGLSLVSSRHSGEVDPDVIVLDLDQPGSLDEVERWRARYPNAFIAGHVGLPRRDLWLHAQHAGCDMVTNRGAFTTQLLHRLPPPGVARRQRVPLIEAGELPGRIGLVLRAPETPLGPIALFHFSGDLYAIEDICPHAGAVLSSGELDGTVLTCPQHGSQFDVCTGTRLRGPADADLQTFTTVEEDGFVCLLLD